VKNVRLIPTLLAVTLMGTLLSTPLAAEEGSTARGRLPDGRAFRVDPHGNQLIDYIAELELEIEELTSRTSRIEALLKEKSGLLDACMKRTSASELETKNLRDACDVESVKLHRSLAACEASTLASWNDSTKNEAARASLRSPTLQQDAPSDAKQ
jgi:hypothetical protein